MFEVPLTADQPYLIYQLLPVSGAVVLDPYEVPYAINFNTGLNTKLNKQLIQSLGEITEIRHCQHYDPTTDTYSTPVVRERFDYDRNSQTQLANYRTQTIEWYLEDGTVGPHPKVLPKKYYRTPAQKRDELQRKRRNQTGQAALITISALMQQGRSEQEALKAGQGYWSKISAEVNAYETGNPKLLRDRLQTDTEPEWLATIRDSILPVLA